MIVALIYPGMRLLEGGVLALVARFLLFNGKIIVLYISFQQFITWRIVLLRNEKSLV